MNTVGDQRCRDEWQMSRDALVGARATTYTHKTVSYSLLAKWSSTSPKATLSSARPTDQEVSRLCITSIRDDRPVDSRLHVAVLERDESLPSETSESPVDLVAEEVEEGVNNERAGLRRSNSRV